MKVNSSLRIKYVPIVVTTIRPVVSKLNYLIKLITGCVLIGAPGLMSQVEHDLFILSEHLRSRQYCLKAESLVIEVVFCVQWVFFICHGVLLLISSSGLLVSFVSIIQSWNRS